METATTRISCKTIPQVDFSYMSVSFESISIQIHLIVSRMDFQIAFVRSLIPHNLRSLRPRTFICACVRIVFSCMRREREKKKRTHTLSQASILLVCTLDSQSSFFLWQNHNKQSLVSNLKAIRSILTSSSVPHKTHIEYCRNSVRHHLVLSSHTEVAKI